MGGRMVREKKNVRAESETGNESRCHAPCFADDERGQTEECGQPLEAGKWKETDSLPEPPERMQACQYLDVSPMELISNFWHPEL